MDELVVHSSGSQIPVHAEGIDDIVIFHSRPDDYFLRQSVVVAPGTRILERYIEDRQNVLSRDILGILQKIKDFRHDQLHTKLVLVAEGDDAGDVLKRVVIRLVQQTSTTSSFWSQILGIIFIRTRHRTTGTQAVESEALGFPPARWDKPIYNYLGFARDPDATTLMTYTTGSGCDRSFGEDSGSPSLPSIIDKGVHKLVLECGYEWASRFSPPHRNGFSVFTDPTSLHRIRVWIRLHVQFLVPLCVLLGFAVTSASLFIFLRIMARNAGDKILSTYLNLPFVFMALASFLVYFFTMILSGIRVRDLNKAGLTLGSIIFMWVVLLFTLSGVNMVVVLVLGLPLGSAAALAGVRAIPAGYRLVSRRPRVRLHRTPSLQNQIGLLETAEPRSTPANVVVEGLNDSPLPSAVEPLRRRASGSDIPTLLFSSDVEGQR